MPDTVPEVFEPFILRNEVLYRNVSNHSFTLDEKGFIGSEAAGMTSLLAWDSEKFTVLQRIITKYTLQVSTVQNWMSTLR